MNHLTEENIEYITKIVNSSKIKSVELKEDLIDHFCCAIEEYMRKGLSFEKSYEKAYLIISPDGFDEIQRDTIFLLTAKRIKTMKQFMYISGYLFLLGYITTGFLKINHIEGGQIVFLITVVILVFLFLPSLFIYLYKRKLTRSINDKLMYVSGLFGVALFVVYAVLKISHWPNTNIILYASVFITCFVFLPLLVFKMYKKSL